MRLNLKDIFLLFIFFLLQVIWFNHVQILHVFTPIVFIYPLLRLPLQKNEIFNLMWAFVYGVTLDIVNNTGGVFAATAVMVTYLRKMYFLFLKNRSFDLENFKIERFTGLQRYVYYFSFIFFSQILIYLLDSWHFSLLWHKIGLILVNTILSLVFFILFDIIFYRTSKA